MTLAEILDMAEMMYPPLTTFTDAQKVTVLNQELRTIFREMQLQEIAEITTVADQAIYTNPSDSKIEDFLYVGFSNVSTITANTLFTEYSFCELNGTLTGSNYFYATETTFGIYPIPKTSGYKGRVIYKKRPTMFDSTDQTASPELREDWHLIFVYSLIAELACSGTNPDIEIANNYAVKHNNLMREIKQSKYESSPKYSTTKDVLGYTRGAGRRNNDKDILIYVPS